MEDRLNSFDSRLGDLVDIMKSNQRLLLENQAQYKSYQAHAGTTGLNSPPKQIADNSLRTEERVAKKRKLDPPADFRDGFLSLEHARQLFTFFDTYISQQLFGFEISKFHVDTLWKTSPILVCAICAIASIHHPDEILSAKLSQLQVYLRRLCSELFFGGKSRDELETFNTIVALVLCSFWLSDSQMFTGLALQLAKEIQLDYPVSKTESSGLQLGRKDRIKLWYLLYVLDGQQSLSFNRQPIVNSQEYSLKNSRKILLEPRKTIKLSKKTYDNDDKTQTEEENQSPFTDLRLVSQVEYNQALNEALTGSAWELLAPSSFGIPSKSNLELDKWMVSWTVLLSPANHGSVWSSKSTLIYYNFAKMHINSASMKGLQLGGSVSQKMYPEWKEPPQNDRKKITTAESNDTDNSSDDSDDDEFISNKGLVSEDEATVSRSIAVSAAQTVLNLVLNDKDIHENLKYVPVHIHIMLYYAALLLLNPEMEPSIAEAKSEASYQKVIANLRTVRSLQLKIYQNLPTDKEFGDRIVKNLDGIFTEKSTALSQKILDEPELTHEVKESLKKQLSQLIQYNGSATIIDVHETSSSDGSSPNPERISAWPGSHHGHP